MSLIKFFLMLKCQVFKSGLYGLSVRNALTKMELKSDLKTRFYARKRKNAFCCTGEVTRPCQGLL